MPPLCEGFRPTTELTEKEMQDRAEIDARRAEIFVVMEALAPPIQPRKFKYVPAKSPVVHYENPELPEDQMMEAYVERRSYDRLTQEVVELQARPVYRKDG